MSEQEYDFIDDGFGNRWQKCREDCDLHIVRPGKVQCDHEQCALQNSATQECPPKGDERAADNLAHSPAVAGTGAVEEPPRITALRNRYDLREIGTEIFAYIDSLSSRLRDAEQDAAAVRELMNVYNLGGWTDAVGPMKRALAAESALAAAREQAAQLEERCEQLEEGAIYAQTARNDAERLNAGLVERAAQSAAELERVKALHVGLMKEADEQRAALISELERVRKDSERLDWLEEQSAMVEAGNERWHSWEITAPVDFHGDVRAAIDRERQALASREAIEKERGR